MQIKDAESINPVELVRHGIRQGERILFKTRNSTYLWQIARFVKDFVFMPDDTANFLTSRRVKVVGVDYLSVGGFKRGGSHAHQTLLGAVIWIIEGLDLSQVKPGSYHLICLPLKLEQGDGTPVRAIIEPVTTGLKDRVDGYDQVHVIIEKAVEQ